MSAFPRNGPLSGMILPALGGFAAVAIGVAPGPFTEPFAWPVGPELANAFLASVAVMAAHKVESYLAREWDACPVYLTLQQDAATSPIGRTLFLSAVLPLLTMLFVLALAFRGPPWPLLLLLAWLGQGLHEWHHLGKTLSRRKPYPGVWTGLLFVAVVDVWVAPEWFALLPPELGPGLWVYYLMQPLVLAAFVVEDLGWSARYAAWKQAA